MRQHVLRPAEYSAKFCRPKMLGREKSEPHGSNVCVPLRFRRSRGNNNSRHVSRLSPCPALLGCFAATQRGTNGRMLVGNQGPGAGGRLLGVQRSGLALKRPCEQGVPMGLLSGQVKKGHSRGELDVCERAASLSMVERLAPLELERLWIQSPRNFVGSVNSNSFCYRVCGPV